MARALWMASQDRTGLHISPSFPVPANKAGVDVVLSTVAYLNDAQEVSVQILASFNNRATYEPYGTAGFQGGVLTPGPGGAPGERKLRVAFNSQNYPTHLKVQAVVAGVVTCGVDVEFLDTL